MARRPAEAAVEEGRDVGEFFVSREVLLLAPPIAKFGQIVRGARAHSISSVTRKCRLAMFLSASLSLSLSRYNLSRPKRESD